MKNSSFYLALALGLSIISCSQSRSDYGEKNTEIDPITADESSSMPQKQHFKLEESEKDVPIKSTLSSNAAVVNKKDTTHQFVRTADLKFKVNNVIEATYSIERIIAQQEGFVTYTNLHSEVNEVIETPVGTDSLLETTKYSIINSMVIRVPNTQLDTALKSMAHLVEFLDYRVIKAEDVALQLLSNRLSHARNGESADRLMQAVAQQRGKLNEVNTVEETIYDRASAADVARIQNLALSDKIEYSTVNIELYQHTGLKRSMVVNDKNLGRYEPSLLQKIGHSLRFGWSILEAVLLFLVKFWPLAIFGMIVFFAIKKFGK